MVYGGRGMTQEFIYEAQQYLTIEKDDGFRRIVNIEDLIKRHGPKKVILFLKEYLKDKEKGLRDLILMDKSQKRIDEYIAAMFRMYMAIKTLEAGKEVKIIERSQFRAEESGQFHKRNRSRDHRSRRWQDRSHDEKNRPARYPTQRAA
jgi:hypothetical protein